METSELSVLFTKIASRIKLCQCGLLAKNLGSSHVASTLSSNLDEKNRSKCASSVMSIENEKGDGSEETAAACKDKEYLKTVCPNCSSDLSIQEKEIVLKMQNAFYKTLQDIGINLETLSSLNGQQVSVDSELSIYEIKCDIKYFKRNAKGETPLHTAARKKDVQAVVSMLRNSVNPNTQDNAGWTPLHEAVFDDNYEITLELLSAGAIVNVPGYDFTTPLHAATHHNNLQMVKLLLKFGADPSVRDISGRSPEFYAKDSNIVALLEEYSGNTEIFEAAKQFQKKAAPRPILIYLASKNLITFTQRNHLEGLNLQFAKILDKNVTHVVVEHTGDNVCEGTFEIMKAILLGCVLVNKLWLHACDKYHKIVNFSEYEVNGTVKHPMTNGPRKARNNFLHLYPPLFTGCHVFLKKMVDTYRVKDLVLASGAKLLNREPNPEHAPANYFLYHCPQGHSMESTSTIILYEEGAKEPKLKYNMKHIKSLPVAWFYDCIQTFIIQEPS